MEVTVENLRENLNTLQSTLGELKKQFEQVSEEWNDTEIALNDINHYQEFLDFTEEGYTWFENTRKQLLIERRKYKTMHNLLAPHIEMIATLEKSLKEADVNEPLLYGIRSVRGYNIFQELHNYVEDSSQKFADLTSKCVTIGYIMNPIKQNPDLFERAELSIEKVEQSEEANIILPPSAVMTEHKSYANMEVREEGEEFRQQRQEKVETSKEKAIRIEHELQHTLRMGSKKMHKWEG